MKIYGLQPWMTAHVGYWCSLDANTQVDCRPVSTQQWINTQISRDPQLLQHTWTVSNQKFICSASEHRACKNTKKWITLRCFWVQMIPTFLDSPGAKCKADQPITRSHKPHQPRQWRQMINNILASVWACSDEETKLLRNTIMGLSWLVWNTWVNLEGTCYSYF